MKSANADPYTKFSKGEVGVDPRIFAREGRGLKLVQNIGTVLQS